MVRAGWVAALLLQGSVSGCAGSPPPRMDDVRLGCYALELGPWRDAPAPTEFSLPTWVRLDSTPGTEPFFPPGARRAYPIRNVFPHSHPVQRAYWQRDGQQPLKLVWTDGFSGATLMLIPAASGAWAGTAQEFSDMGGMPTASADVTATPTQCAGVDG